MNKLSKDVNSSFSQVKNLSNIFQQNLRVQVPTTYPIKIKLVWCFPSCLKDLWLKMLPKYQIFFSFEESTSFENADIVIVVNDSTIFPFHDDKILSKTLFLKMEPEWYNIYWENIRPERLLSKWDHSNINNFNMVEWHLPFSFDELKHLNYSQYKNTNKISSILSGKNFYKMQKIRLDFALYAQHDLDWDAFGSSSHLPWKNFLGILPDHDKSKALLTYKYSFACENNLLPNYVTEKLYDCILTETLCFYCGAPNVSEIVDERSYVQINLDDFEKALKTIKKCIENNEWEKRIHFIKHTKQYILNHLSLYPRLKKLCQTKPIFSL